MDYPLRILRILTPFLYKKNKKRVRFFWFRTSCVTLKDRSGYVEPVEYIENEAGRAPPTTDHT